MAAPKSVMKINKNGVTFTESVDRANYFITELTRAAMKDVARYVNDSTRVSCYITFDTCTNDWSFWHHQRNSLTHHV